jgi:hypothetical protein
MKECPLAYALLFVRGGEGEGEWALVDADLFPRLLSLGPWYAHKARKCTYVRSWRAGHKREYLHAAVQRMRRRRRPSEDHVVRHLSGDTFDNTDANLRWGSKRKNQGDTPYRER